MHDAACSSQDRPEGSPSRELVNMAVIGCSLHANGMPLCVAPGAGLPDRQFYNRRLEESDTWAAWSRATPMSSGWLARSFSWGAIRVSVRPGSPRPWRRNTTTCSSSAPASPESAPPSTCIRGARARATSSSKAARRWAAPGISSAIRASAPTATCTRSATASSRGARRRRSPTARRSSSYVKETAAEYGVDEHIRYRPPRDEGRLVERGCHLDGRGAAQRTPARPSASPATSSSCAPGYYSYRQGYTPEFEGIERFRGTIVHPQQWPEDLDYAGKKVVVIGSGATAMTLVPAMAKDVAPHRHAAALADLRRVASRQGRDRQRACARCCPSAGPMRSRAGRTSRCSSSSIAARARIRRRSSRSSSTWCARSSGPDYDVETHFTPSYNPWDQRLCLVPNSDLFAAIRSGKASVVTDQIERFTETGIALDVRPGSSTPTSS